MNQDHRIELLSTGKRCKTQPTAQAADTRKLPPFDSDRLLGRRGKARASNSE